MLFRKTRRSFEHCFRGTRIVYCAGGGSQGVTGENIAADAVSVTGESTAADAVIATVAAEMHAERSAARTITITSVRRPSRSV